MCEIENLTPYKLSLVVIYSDNEMGKKCKNIISSLVKPDSILESDKNIYKSSFIYINRDAQEILDKLALSDSMKNNFDSNYEKFLNGINTMIKFSRTKI
jgi:hypothetical protein